MEAGTDLRYTHKLPGHKSSKTTEIYLQCERTGYRTDPEPVGSPDSSTGGKADKKP